MKKKFVAAAMLVFSSAWANDEKKISDDLFQCLDKHKSNVAKNIVSLEEGALLMIESLCGNEAYTFANFMARTREDNNRPNYIDRFHNELHVVKRDTKLIIYYQKIKK
jgi:hypothetical protein